MGLGGRCGYMYTLLTLPYLRVERGVLSQVRGVLFSRGGYIFIQSLIICLLRLWS